MVPPTPHAGWPPQGCCGSAAPAFPWSCPTQAQRPGSGLPRRGPARQETVNVCVSSVISTFRLTNALLWEMPQGATEDSWLPRIRPFASPPRDQGTRPPKAPCSGVCWPRCWLCRPGRPHRPPTPTPRTQRPATAATGAGAGEKASMSGLGVPPDRNSST